MIVNTAYMYMGEKGPSVNPNIWEGGTVNYPYKVYGTSSFQPNYSRFSVIADSSVTFTLPLKKFTKITFSVIASVGRQQASSFSLIKNGVTGGTQYFRATGAEQSIAFNIPTEYQDDDVIVMIKASETGSFYLLSGVMS